MAFNAKTHRVIHLALGDRLRVHIAMAFGAVHSRSNVRRVIELHVRGGLKSVNSLPWNVLASRAIGRELFDLRLVGGDHLMARHAEVDARDSGVRALIHADMAVRALHPIGKVHFMGVGDGLHRLGARAEEFPNRVRCAVVKIGEVCAAGWDAVLESSAGMVRPRIAPVRTITPRIIATRSQRFTRNAGNDKSPSWNPSLIANWPYYMCPPPL